jgi:hypothetical protein
LDQNDHIKFLDILCAFHTKAIGKDDMISQIVNVFRGNCEMKNYFMDEFVNANTTGQHKKQEINTKDKSIQKTSTKDNCTGHLAAAASVS